MSKTKTSATSSLGACAETKTGEVTQSSAGATSPKKAPSKPYRVNAIKPVASVMGREKTTDIGDNDTKTPDHPTRKSETKVSPEDKPQAEASKPEKVVTKPCGASDTRSDRETGSKNADDILIVHDGTKHTHSESSQARPKRKHDEKPRPVSQSRRPG